MKRILILAFLVSFGVMTYAQGDYEALLFSQTEYMGTARYMGVCGAFSATGADFSALNSNPATIGLYKRNEFSFTPVLVSLLSTETRHYGTESCTFNPKYTVPQVGCVGVRHLGENSGGWKAWQFAGGFNRIMDFNSINRIEGSDRTSIINPMIAQAQGLAPSQLTGDAKLLWETFMMDPLPESSNQYFSPFQNEDIKQTSRTYTEGGIDEISLTFGGNYKDQLFLGVGIGMPIMHYRSKTYLTEQPVVTDGKPITSCKTNTLQEDNGTGINLKLGLIYQPFNFMRIGLGFQTPTYYWNIQDAFYREMQAVVFDTLREQSYTNRFNFSLTTPLKANVSTSFIIAKRAFINLEYELTDYRMPKLFANEYNFENENQAIADKYKICHTVRLGTEVSLLPHFMLRAGYTYKSSPFKEKNGPFNGSANYASIGFGYRGNYFFFDMTYVYKYSRNLYWMYDPDFIEPTEMTQNTHRIVATIGYKF